MRVEDGRVEPETFSWVKFSGLSWRHDNTRFFNRRYPAPNMLFCILMRVVTQSTGFTIVTCRHFVMGLEIRELKSGSLVHQLPIDTGSVHGISARREDSSVFIGFTSFVTAGVIYQRNLDNEIPDMKVFHEITVPVFDRADFHVDQLITASKCCFVCGIFNSPGEFPSKDGTETPMFVVAGKNILLDGSHPCFLYGYSGFNISLTPSFSVSRIVLARHLGAVLLLFCIANMGVESMGRNGIKQGPSHKSKIALMTLFPPLDIFRLYPTQEVVCQRWKQCWASYWSLHKPEA